MSENEYERKEREGSEKKEFISDVNLFQCPQKSDAGRVSDKESSFMFFTSSSLSETVEDAAELTDGEGNKLLKRRKEQPRTERN